MYQTVGIISSPTPSTAKSVFLREVSASKPLMLGGADRTSLSGIGRSPRRVPALPGDLFSAAAAAARSGQKPNACEPGWEQRGHVLGRQLNHPALLTLLPRQLQELLQAEPNGAEATGVYSA